MIACMKQFGRDKFKPAIPIILMAVLAGCSGNPWRYGEPVANAKVENRTRPGGAMIVFVRSAEIASKTHAAIYELVGEKRRFIGMLGERKKLVHHVPPGEKLFAVIGLNVSFMRARMDAGKAYYADIVTTGAGTNLRDFVLQPISQNKAKGRQFRDQFAHAKWVTKSRGAINWEERHRRSILIKLRKFQHRWNRQKNKSTLRRGDGLIPPLRP
jgi:hypothetical protein